ncbi:hypothetical protein HGRIS_002635 [Hohenbuehelia grisea]|uniref:Uncharacterized protein n=1 Tax=Hohenbuehelia grisea TaxID=104357 RepID=A0ABR3JLZ9_9AGAR
MPSLHQTRMVLALSLWFFLLFGPAYALPINKRQSNGGPTTLMTVHKAETIAGTMTETCVITLTPITDVNGRPAVEEVRRCSISMDAGGQSSVGTASASSTSSSSAASATSTSSDSAASTTSTSSGSASSGTSTSASSTSSGATSTTDSSSASATSSALPNLSAALTPEATAPPAVSVIGTTLVSASAVATGSQSASASASTTSASTTGSAASAATSSVSGSASATTTSSGTPTASAANNAASDQASGSSAASEETPSAAAAFALPGKKLSVLPIGLGVFAGISVIALIVVGLVTYERTKYRKAFRQRKLAESGASMGYGGMAQRT